MSGTVFAVQPTLPAQLTGTYPIVVTKTGLTYNIAWAMGSTGSVTKRQWFEAVATLYNMNTLYAAVMANAGDATWIQFQAGYTVEPGDLLATLTQTTFGLGAAQMSALFTLAVTLTP